MNGVGGEYFEHKTIRIIRNGQTTVTVVETEETKNHGSPLIQHTEESMVKDGGNGSTGLLSKADLMKYAHHPSGWYRARLAFLLLLWVVIVGLTGAAIYTVVQSKLNCPEEPWAKSWWKKSLFYQINVKTFQDSNHDGIGDLAGVKSRLDYLQSMGVQTLLLNPFFKGFKANSFAVLDFNSIDPSVGTIDDFDELCQDIHGRNMTLVIDLILPDTAIEHAWFTASQALTKDMPVEGASLHDFYVWHEGNWDTTASAPDGSPIPGPPNTWKNLDDGRTSAWTWSASRQRYYLHQHSSALPTLNYGSATLLNVMDETLRFWLRHGVNGFRFLNMKDVFAGPTRYAANFSDPDLSVESTALLKRWRNVVSAPSNGGRIAWHRLIMVDGEGLRMAQLGLFGVDLVFNRNLMKWDSTLKNPGQEIAAFIEKTLKTPSGKSHASWAIGNYDQHRIASRIGSLELVDAANIIYLLLPGTAVAFYGDELGLKDRIESKQGTDRYPSEGPQITPMLWTYETFAGFTNSSKGAYLPIAKAHQRTPDVQSQERYRHSHLKVFQQLAALRQTPAIRSGSYRAGVLGESVFSFVRQLKNGAGYLVMVDLRRNGLYESHPREYSLSSAHLTGRGRLVLGSVSLYNKKNGDHSPLAVTNATIDLSASIVLRESEAVVIQFGMLD